MEHHSPFTLDMQMTIEVDEISLTEVQRNQAVEAFIRASNTAYEAKSYNCQPEFRRLERTRNQEFTVQATRHLDAEDAAEDNSIGKPREHELGRDLQQARKKFRMTVTLKIDGTCNQCSKQHHVGDRTDVSRIVSYPPKSRYLQQQPLVYNMSNCFCPLGSQVASETASRTTMMRLFQEELTFINSPIKAVISMNDISPKKDSRRRLSMDEDSTRRGRTRRLQVAPTPSPTEQEPLSSIPSPPSNCPMVKLDFNNFTNPMSRFYGQSATLQGGDYLYDQLWSSHGVRVSALATNDYYDRALWIPRFVRGSGWVKSSPDQDLSDYRTGGFVRLFDTGRPNHNTNPLFNQPLCPAPHGNDDKFPFWGYFEPVGVTNPELGSPNSLCPIPGSGKSYYRRGVHVCIRMLHVSYIPNRHSGTGWFGRPEAPYPNCDPLGLVCIVQRDPNACPERSGLGARFTFEFREPLEFVKAMTFLDIKGYGPTPDVTVFYDQGKQITIDTPVTGDNSVYTLPFKTSLYKNVTRIDINIEQYGVLSSLEFPSCVKPMKPLISVKKYVGPPDLCTASSVGSMQDDVYTLPITNAMWAYCYVISVPSNSEECLYDVTLTDPAPIGGTNGTQKVTTVGETVCQGQSVYFPGITRSGVVAQEGPFDATVEGYGYYSGTQVINRDPGSVQPPISTCPLVKLDFTNLPNPMARYYGQPSTFRAGD